MELHLRSIHCVNCISLVLSGADETDGDAGRLFFLAPPCLPRVDCLREDERRTPCLTEEALERCSVCTLCTPGPKSPAALLTREEPFPTFGTTRARC